MTPLAATLLIVLLLLITAILVVNYRDLHRFVTVSYEISADKLQSNLTICLLADLHEAVFGTHNDTLIAAVKDCNPDLILVPGDLVTAYYKGNYEGHKVRPEEAIHLVEELCKVAPVFFAPGNHETKMKLYERTYDGILDRIYDAYRKAGAVILEDESVPFSTAQGETIVLTGLELDYPYFGHFRKRPLEAGYLEKKIGAHDETQYQILLAHNPLYFEEYAAYGADLTVSGHVHGGMVRLPYFGGVISPAAVPFPKYDGGLFTIGDRTMVLSRGLGMHSVPIRFGNPGEVVVIHLTGGQVHCQI